MRKPFILFLLALIITMPAIAQQQEEFKPSGKVFGLLFTDYHTRFSAGKSVPAFQVTRSYLGYDYSFSKSVSGRVLFDGITQVIEGKTMMTAYLRNAYLQYADEKLTIKGGLIGSEELAVAEKLWNYRYVFKPAMDYFGMIYPIDLGLSAKYTPSKFITLDAAIINGRGYKDILPDTTLKLQGGVTVNPVKNITVRGYFDLMGPSSSRQSTVNLTAAWTATNITVGGSFFAQQNHLMTDGFDYSGYSIFTAWSFLKKYSAFARVDHVGSATPDGESEPWNLSKDGTNFYIGMDWQVVKNVRISANFIGFEPDDATKSFTGAPGVSVEARF